jgi:hypothetical protein
LRRAGHTCHGRHGGKATAIDLFFAWRAADGWYNESRGAIWLAARVPSFFFPSSCRGGSSLRLVSRTQPQLPCHRDSTRRGEASASRLLPVDRSGPNAQGRWRPPMHSATRRQRNRPFPKRGCAPERRDAAGESSHRRTGAAARRRSLPSAEPRTSLWSSWVRRSIAQTAGKETEAANVLLQATPGRRGWQRQSRLLLLVLSAQ